MGEVAHLFICLVHRFPMKELDSVEAIENKGFRGCIHGRPGTKRQVCLMDVETLEKFELAPGEIKENITVRGIDFQKLQIGQEMQVGGAKLRVTIPCDPCNRMDEIRMGLQEELRGQRGWLCRVVEPGTIRKGDKIELIERSEMQDAVNQVNL